MRLMNHATLEMFIAKRMAELEQIEEPLMKLLAETQENLTAIAKEKEMLLRAIEAAGLKVREIGTIESASHTKRPKKIEGKTLKEATLEILARHKMGLSAAEILKLLNTAHGTDFDRSSLSPQISRLKQDGIIEQVGRLWRIKDPSENKNPNESSSKTEKDP